MRHTSSLVRLSAFLCCAVASLDGQSRGESRQPVDVCKLLAGADVEAILGESVKETTRSTQAGGALRISQCMFATASPAKSISLELAERKPAAASTLTPREFWRKQFHPAPAGNLAKRPEPEDEREARPISGVGDEAFWVGNSITGALYVLRGSYFLRISVGGIREESARIEKSKALARAAVQRH